MSILVPCAQQKDKDELGNIQDIFFTDFDGIVLERILAGLEQKLPVEYQPEEYLYYLHRLADKHGITKLLNTCDYPGCIYTSVLGRERGLRVPELDPILLCQHKYYARCAQKESVPDATPRFAIVRHDALDDVKKLTFPLFVKPVKSYLSVFAKKVHDMNELQSYLKKARISEQFLLPFNWGVSTFTDYEYDGSYFIAEELLKGEQCTLEGYVYNGFVGLIGIVDSIMIPNTISFERFVFPSQFPEHIQKKMLVIAQQFISSIGLDNSLFNIEFMYDKESDYVGIIEVNPRMSGQFSDLFRMVNGVCSYQVLYDIVEEKQPAPFGNGEFKVAASLVQRQLNDMKVTAIPTADEIKKAQEKYPELLSGSWVTPGQTLSDVLQDGVSYVYNILHLGAQSLQELQEKYDDCKELLPFKFE